MSSLRRQPEAIQVRIFAEVLNRRKNDALPRQDRIGEGPHFKAFPFAEVESIINDGLGRKLLLASHDSRCCHHDS